jgi:transcription-repair coupling factor (superfamily II helicase)
MVEQATQAQFEHWISGEDEVPASGTKFVATDALTKAMIVAQLRRRTKAPLVAVFKSRAEARNAIDNLSFFVGSKLKERMHYLPALEFDYHRGLLPNPEILCERNVGLLHAMNDPEGRIFFTTVGAVLQKAVPPTEFLRATRVIAPNDEILRDDLLRGLTEAGYQRQPTAYDPGVFSVRGGVIDIFCPLYPKPARIEFFGDLVDEIRFFDPKTQLSQEKLEKVYLIPVGISLVPHGEDFMQAANLVKDRLDALEIPKLARDEVLENIRSGSLQPEYSYLFPLLSKGSSPLFEYFPKDTVYIWDGQEEIETVATESDIPKQKKSHELFEKQPFPIAEYSDLFISEEDLAKKMSDGPRYFWEPFVSKESPEEIIALTEETRLNTEREQMKSRKSAQPLLEAFAKRFRDWMDQGYRLHVVSHTGTHAERLSMLLAPYGIRTEKQNEVNGAFPSLLKSDFAVMHLWQGYISESRVFPKLRLVILSEEEIFGHKKRAAKSSSWSQTDAARALSTFRDLNVGDYIVHKDFGIGKYLGLKSMTFMEVPNDYVLLEYRDGDKLYIPVYRLNVLQKYVGGEGSAPLLDKLGAESWLKAKSKAQRAIAELAAEFLNLHAKRRMIAAHKFPEPGQEYSQFEMEFPFDETPDQMKAIEDVQNDLSQSHPMDRLVCGDVGYGKTEIAMRAAFRAISDGKQVAVLVPTTVLAFQHFENFKRRFKNSAAVIEMVSRMRGPTETKAVLQRVKEGKVDILIGTHRLLSADVEFKSFGLLVIDEEHRFGVVHKEKLKKMSETVHVLSMTATPIPRTLNMAMTGIKDISLITTPPPDRLSVRTFVCRKSEEIICEAIQNELLRDGQVFFVHNRIETIFGIADDLKKLLPKVRFEIAHGQMDGETLEKKMMSFYQGEAQVLLSTAIIESGLDIPRANTIIIDKADHFGLAQLYQLRGRVGRSEKRAYCYLLVPNETQMTADAKQRLQVIQRYTDLGSGFNIASHDLEIRGAGDLLGRDQSGHLNAVGVDMYFELLEESIRELRGQEKKIQIEPEITLKISAHFPNDYLPDVGERVQLYRRLSSIDSVDRISDIEAEIRDRFGTLPPEVENLLGLMTMKHYLKQLHVVRMSSGPKRTSLQFAETTPASPEKLVKLITTNPKNYQMTPDQKFVYTVEDTDWKHQLSEIQKLCSYLDVPVP